MNKNKLNRFSKHYLNHGMKLIRLLSNYFSDDQAMWSSKALRGDDPVATLPLSLIKCNVS